MVIGSKMWRNREGGSKKGCLFTLLLLAVATYYGIGIGGHYVQYLRLLDEMRTQLEAQREGLEKWRDDLESFRADLEARRSDLEAASAAVETDRAALAT